MLAINKTRKFIESDPAAPAAQILSSLVLALETESPFVPSDLYQMDYPHFELALEILSEWRLDRHYASKMRLLDISTHLKEMTHEAAIEAVTP